MKALRWFLGGLVFAIIAQIVGGIVYGMLFPNWYSVETATELFRPLDSMGFKVGLPVLNLVEGLLLSLVYAIFYKAIPGKRPITKGAFFGFLLWLVGPFTGTLINFATENMRFPLPCLVDTLIIMVLGCKTIAKIWGKSLEIQKE